MHTLSYTFFLLKSKSYLQFVTTIDRGFIQLASMLMMMTSSWTFGRASNTSWSMRRTILKADVSMMAAHRFAECFTANI